MKPARGVKLARNGRRDTTYLATSRAGTDEISRHIHRSSTTTGCANCYERRGAIACRRKVEIGGRERSWNKGFLQVQRSSTTTKEGGGAGEYFDASSREERERGTRDSGQKDSASRKRLGLGLASNKRGDGLSPPLVESGDRECRTRDSDKDQQPLCCEAACREVRYREGSTVYRRAFKSKKERGNRDPVHVYAPRSPRGLHGSLANRTGDLSSDAQVRERRK